MNSCGIESLRPAGASGRRLVGALVVLALVALAGCGSSGSSKESTGGTTGTTSTEASNRGAALDGRTFTSTSVTGHELVAGSTVQLTFEDAMLIASAGCNTMRAPYAFDGSTLRWTEAGTATMMGCEPELMTQDQWLSELLTDGAQAELEGTTLALVAGDVRLELVDGAGAGGSEAAELTDTTWILTTLVDGATASSVPDGVEAPTLTIAADGAASVFTGCNTGGTTVEIAGSALVFDLMATTMMMCEPDAAAVEATVLALLEGEVGFELAGEQLSITKGDQSLVFRAI